MTGFLTVLRRELRIALRRKGDALNVLAFFVVVASLFPLGVGPEPNQLRAMAAGVAWIAALLAALDAEGIEQVGGLCAAHLAGGGMLVLTSHQDVTIPSAASQDLELR